MVQQENDITILPLSNFEFISDKLQISKVVLYFEKSNIFIPKTTIQNYIKENVLSPLIENRYYSKQNILEIYLTVILKEFFTLNEISTILKKIFSFNIQATEVYNLFIFTYENYLFYDNKKEFETELNEFFYIILSLKITKNKILNF
ncbi:MAG: DUF1836 domain-containing protein [Lachnospirales bacterium]